MLIWISKRDMILLYILLPFLILLSPIIITIDLIVNW